MKIGIRTPSLKKSIKARTTGRAKRIVKRSVDPTYGKKGAGWVKDPKKAAYNKVYNKTTLGINPVSNNKSRLGDTLEGIGYILQAIGYLVQAIFYLGILIGLIYIIIKFI
ncbi:hypothetical protein HF846_03235 [Clostridium cadaveris]|uniref:hypothetical protein n=1 Tax=Clostridium cadaveris TaxID=1529 RepID=UPI0014595B19|nr:hypothetical protein [Clostridium cadaveris]NME63612.1 hypothetical protein [Clostridium cadaveris]